MSTKPIVFVITPFDEDFLALYEELKRIFGEKFEFSNAKDLDNQQNILQDIVEGIHNAQVIIADLTGLNANVFYELGLAHAMNKKVIIITQDISELPFDIKAYRANEYSLQFNKLPFLIEKLDKLLDGAVKNTVSFGNPVSDYLPNYYTQPCETEIVETSNNDTDEIDSVNEDGEKGFLDYIADIEENTYLMSSEINTMSQEMQENSDVITSSTIEINKVKLQSGRADAAFVRNICRKISDPTELLANQIKGHTENISKYWSIIENNYLDLLDNKYAQTSENLNGIKDSMSALKEMQTGINDSNLKIENFISVLGNTMGMERKLNKAITSLISELEHYLLTTNTMSSSIDRIISKSNLLIPHMCVE